MLLACNVPMNSHTHIHKHTHTDTQTHIHRHTTHTHYTQQSYTQHTYTHTHIHYTNTRLKNAGATYEELKEASKNGTRKEELFRIKNLKKDKKGYNAIMGRGTLDQRLRATIAFKRSTAAEVNPIVEGSGLTNKEEADLNAMMENDDDNDNDDDGDGDGDGENEFEDEETEYETLVLAAIEQNKLNDVSLSEYVNTPASTNTHVYIIPIYTLPLIYSPMYLCIPLYNPIYNLHIYNPI
jgi:hypothetical protein